MRDSEVLNRAQQTKCHGCNFPSMPITIANRKARHHHVGVTNSLNLVNCDLFNNWDLKQYREVKVSLKFPYFLFDNSFWKGCHTQLFRSIPFWYRCKNFFSWFLNDKVSCQTKSGILAIAVLYSDGCQIWLFHVVYFCKECPAGNSPKLICFTAILSIKVSMRKNLFEKNFPSK